MRTLAPLMDFSQSALFFDLYLQFEFFHLIISVYTVLFFGRPLRRLPFGLSLNLTFFSFTIHPINMSNPIQQLILTNENIYKSPKSCINSLLQRFLQFAFTLFPQTPHLKLLSKIASRLEISLINVQDYAPYVATGHILI